MKDLDNPTVGPVHLQVFRPSVIKGPWIIYHILHIMYNTLVVEDEVRR